MLWIPLDGLLARRLPRSWTYQGDAQHVVVADLGLSPEALEVYEELERDQSRWPILDALEAAIDAVAADPGQRANRQRRFRDPPCFAVPVPTSEGDWIVLWREVSDSREFEDLVAGDVFVLYLGPLPT
jgi:hypothetical protein